ncbi:hypothetical protein XELAEV_18045141mg [Xenopus laevis]|uniref:Vitellogenin domain-containing protein n=1 Tax=Xenopus laevis TaxID=8355 RepID=A0A974H4F1_XENLA|nr:hypothetical protein XELAEV_18045141mg [Xenopus laevis]
MELHAVLLWVFAAGFMGKAQEISEDSGSCMSDCPGTGQLNFQKGSRYIYSYSTSTGTFLEAGSSARRDLTLECEVHIEVMGKCHMVLKLMEVNIRTTEMSENSSKEFDSLRDALEKMPLQFSYHDGKIQKLCPSSQEPTWSLNIKRGILSVLQGNLKVPSTGKSIVEVDVLGRCPTSYELRGNSVWKRKDLSQCSNRVLGSTSIRSVALPDKTQLLDSHLECFQTFKDGTLTEATCNESHLVTVFSREGNGAKTQTRTLIKLIRVEVDMSPNKDITGKHYVTNLMYEKETILANLNGENVAETVRNLCLAPSTNYEAADLFMNLVFELRLLSAAALSDLWQRSSFKCRDNWQPLLDALPSCGTEACVGLMKDILLANELEDEKAESFLWSLAFLPEPTVGMVRSLVPLLQEEKAGQSVYLAITALLHHFCSITRECHKIPEVQTIMGILQEQLRDNCTKQEDEEIHKMQLVLKAIGNAGLAAESLIPVLASCASLKSNPDSTRLAAVEAFRRIPCSANRTILTELYQSVHENEEIRIASYYTAMKCPSQDFLHIVRQMLKHEKSMQVGSFVWSHLSQLLESDDPLKQDLADSLPDDILSKDFEGEFWKYSSYSDATVLSESAGANMEASMIFTPSSFIPRSAMANLTVHAMGRAMNILEFGIRLENAEDLVKRMLGHPSFTSNKAFVRKDEENTNSGTPIEIMAKANDKKTTSKRYTHGESPAKKPDQQKMKNLKHSCPTGKYNKINEIQQKFTKGMKSVRNELKCGLSMKIFGNELNFLDCEGVKHTIKQYSLSMAELAVRLLKGQEVQYSKRMGLATEEITFPTLSGFPVQLSLNATLSTSVKIRGNMDFKQQANFYVNGYIKPSALIQLSSQMGIVGTVGKMGLRWVTGLKAMSSVDGGIQMKKGQELKIFLNTPDESMEIFNFSSTLYQVTPDGLKTIINPVYQKERKACMNEEVSKLFGWQPCLDVSYPEAESLLPFPLSGPVKVSLVLRKQDKGLRQYLLEASYNQIPQKDDWIPNEATLHFFMGTPKSEIRRDVGIDLHYNIQHRKFRITLLHPRKKIQLNGKIESSRNSRNGHLELILDDKEIYYIKGLTDLQTAGGEQRYTALAEVKLTKYGSPIILSGNLTKQFGKKIAFSFALNNLLKDTAFVSAVLDKKADDKLKQYSLEGEAYIPGVFGSYAIGLLQKRGDIWTNAVRVKYGLLGDAKYLQHECDTGQKIKMDTNSDDQYRVDVEHEFHCTQMPSFNHKVHLNHEERISHIHSMLEVSYGKHWDEMNNKKKLFISQTFKNNSSPSAASYFMEFTLQVSEKQVNYRTQLIHTHSALESNTNFKMQYNDKVPFVAGLQWKDTSKNDLQKWEGAFTMDTPWLYLYSALKRYQPQRYAYQTIIEMSAGKALTIKNLVLEMFYKDKGNEKEGKIHIHTPTATYLRASTVNFIGGNAFRSYSEMVSLWNQLLKNEIHLENNEKIKLFTFKIKGSKQEFNFSAGYRSIDWPKKTNFSIKTMWTDQKSYPLILQLDGQIEELKKDKMLYQKQGLLYLRHPFKVPVPQSILLQETFTVDKQKRHYMLETKLLMDGIEECVQTITLGYNTDNLYICADLRHPYKHQVFPNNLEICASTKRQALGKTEIEATIKANKRNVFGLTGMFQNKSSKRELWHVLRMDMTHSFQLRIPRALIFDGEIFSRHTKQDEFNHGIWGKIIINRNNTLQLHAQLNRTLNQMGFFSYFTHPFNLRIPHNIQADATVKRYGARDVNGTFTLHWGKEVLLFEVDLNNDSRTNIGIIGLSASLHQTVLADPLTAHLRITGKTLPSRFSLLSETTINNQSLVIELLGSKEQKVGLALAFSGNLMHTINGLTIIPHQFLIEGSIKQKKNINEGIPMAGAVEVTLENTSINRTFGIALDNGKSRIDISLGLERMLPVSQLTARLKHNVGDLKFHGLPYNINGICYYQSADKGIVSGMAVQAEDEHIKAEVNKKTTGDTSNIILSLQNDLSSINYIIPSSMKVTCNGEFTSSLFYGHCNGDIARKTAQFSVPLRTIINGSLLANGYKTNLFGLVSMGDEFGRITINTESGSQNTIEIGFKHALPQLHTLGITKDNKIRISATRQGKAGTIVDISIGKCLIKASAETREENNGSDTSFLNWTTSIFNSCSFTEKLNIPKNLLMNGSLQRDPCGFGLAIKMGYDENDAHLLVKKNCDPYFVEGSLNHSIHHFHMLGLPSANQFSFSTSTAPSLGGHIMVQSGQCRIGAKAEVMSGNKTEWMLLTETDCKPLKDLHIPSQSRVNGSLVINGCEAELLCALTFNGNSSEIQVRSECQPKMKMEIEFRHNLFLLKGISEESKMSVVVGKLSNYNIEMLLQSGTCAFEIKGDIHADNKLQWKMLLENKCKTIQDLGAPLKIDGSGYIVVNKKANLDSQMLIVVDESTLQGLLILKVSEKKQELDAILTHNIQHALNLGVPKKAVLDMTTERSSELYKRSIQLSLDNKQIQEEMSFYQKADHLSISYKIIQNLDVLKKIHLEDRLEMEATVDLKEIRNISVSTHYGPRVMNASVQITGNETRTNLTTNILHNWPWLLQNKIPASLKVSMGIQATEDEQEVTLQTTAAETWMSCTVALLGRADESKVHIRSLHNSDIFPKYGYPKAVALNGRLCTLCMEGNKSSVTLGVDFGKKILNVDVSALREQPGSMNINAGVEHSFHVLRILGIPSVTQMVLQLILTNKNIGGNWKLICDRKTHIFITANARTQQQRDEVNIKAVHNVPFLQPYIPNSSNLITKVSYSINEAGASAFLKMDDKEIKVSTMLNVTVNSYTSAVQLEHTVPQLKTIPAHIEIRTAYEKSHRTCALRQETIWGSKEVTLMGVYTGQFPKLSGGHELMGEFSQSLFPKAIRHGKVKMYLEHSVHNHQDRVTIGWNGRDQAGISSSLKIGKERLDCRLGISHPFNFTVRHLEVSSLSENRGSKYNHQTQIAWNKGLPVNLRITLDDKLMNDSRVWNACVSILPGQIQQLISVGNIQACGYMEKDSTTFQQYMDIMWNSKKFQQTMMYEKHIEGDPDTLQLEAIFENIFPADCNKHHISAKMGTNYMDTVEHVLQLELCNLQHPIVISGKHSLNKGELLRSENRLSFTSNERDDALFTLALDETGTQEEQNYSLSLRLRASENIKMGLIGQYSSSSFQHEVQLQTTFNENDVLTMNASSGKRCFQVNVAQKIQGNSEEKGVELSGCTDSQYLAAVNTYLRVNGVRDRLGQLVLSASNQSLSFYYQGCGEAIAKAENLLGNIGLHLKTQIVEINKKLDTYVKGFQRIVQQYEFLQEAAGWPTKISQDIAGALQNVPKSFNQMWKQSGLRQALRHDLPIYFERLNNLVKQMQTELQRPLVTLKDAYYDATLKPLEDVWQEKTEAWLRKINAFLPSIVKDEWLMDPVRRLVDVLKAGLDVGTHQLLKWTDAKLSRAVSKIRKPLTRLFSYSSNCTVMLNFPLLPKEYHLTGLANITHYIIEEKLMKPIKDMYSMNLMAEYYRFKRSMMESPFEYHAVLIGNKRIVTFDGILLNVASKCNLLLAKDFVHNKFTLILNQGGGTMRSLHVDMNHVSVDIYPGLKIEENCQRLDLPVFKNGISIKKDANRIEVTNHEGITVQCDIYHDICSFTLEGWYHGISAGLFGTNDNESGNDYLLPDHTYTNSTQDFSLKWQVDTQCNSGRKKIKSCPTSPHQKLCKALFQGANSVLRNCFRVIYPQPFYNACVEDICESNEIKPICNLAAAYVHLCNRNFVPIEIPSQCA